MSKKSSVSMVLSQEELFVAMLHLKADAMAGLDLATFKQLDARQTDLVIGVAERALLARGFLKPDQKGDLHLEPAIQGMLSACIHPDRTLFVSQTRPEVGPQEVFFHTIGKTFVMHSEPVTAMHQFIAVDEKNATSRAVLSILSLPKMSKPDCEGGRIGLSFFEKARDAALEAGAEAAVKILTAKLSKKTSRELAQTLAGPVANTTFALLHHHGEVQAPLGFSILQGKNALWRIAPVDDPGDELISIEPLSSDEVIKQIKTVATE